MQAAITTSIGAIESSAVQATAQPGNERSNEPRSQPAPCDVGAEAAAHAALRLIAEHPGQMGRLRAARIIGGYPVPHRDEQDAIELAQYAIELDWPLREITRLVDALISGRLVVQTSGPRPVLVLTRSGFRALEALEGSPASEH